MQASSRQMSAPHRISATCSIKCKVAKTHKMLIFHSLLIFFNISELQTKYNPNTNYRFVLFVYDKTVEDDRRVNLSGLCIFISLSDVDPLNLCWRLSLGVDSALERILARMSSSPLSEKAAGNTKRSARNHMA